MESVSDYYLFWGIYLIAALVGFWCWGKMAFWVSQQGVLYHLYSALGAVLIFTPVAVPEASGALAPGFIAVAFSLISLGVGAGLSSLAEFAPWYGAASVLALVATAIGFIAGLTPTLAEENSQSTSRQAKSTPPRQKHVKGNPFA